MENESENAAIIEAAAKFGETEVIDIGDYEVLSIPDGRKIVSVKPLLDEYRTAPERCKGTIKVTKIQSLVDVTKRFSDTDSVIFADVANRQASRLISVFDYNRAATTGRPRFGQHRAVYEFPLSDEWKAWLAADGNPMDQATMARFMEDRIVDVMDPETIEKKTQQRFRNELGITLASPAKLMELSRGLTIHADVKVRGQINPSSGERSIQYDESHNDDENKPLKVPGGFVLGIPVFRGEQTYQIPVRLRYKLTGGNISWSVTLFNVWETWDEAVTGAAMTVQKDTGLPLYYGTPES